MGGFKNNIDDLVKQLGPRGTLVPSYAVRSKLLSWLQLMTGFDFDTVRKVNLSQVAVMYNDTTNEKLQAWENSVKHSKAQQEKVKAVESKTPAAIEKLTKDVMPATTAAMMGELIETVFNAKAEELAAKLLKGDALIKLIQEKAPGIPEKRVRELIAEHAPVQEKTIVFNSMGEDATFHKPVDLGRQHYKFELLLRCLKAGLNVALVGPAATSKTTSAMMAAKALGLDFYSQSFSDTMSEGKMLGYKDAAGIYHTTPFREAFEKGGLYCGDEADNGNANCFAVLNSALANGHCSFPDKPAGLERHGNFVSVINMNTYGTGASRLFVGRNQLDAATLDRYIMIDWDIDNSLEAHMVGVKKKSPKFDINEGGTCSNWEWLDFVRDVRAAIDKHGVRHIVSPRATLFGVKMLGVGIGRKHIEEAVIWKGMKPDVKQRILEECQKQVKPEVKVVQF